MYVQKTPFPNSVQVGPPLFGGLSLGTLICLFFFPALSPVLWLVQLAGGGLLMRTAAFLCGVMSPW